jgi:hypothetical protein
MNVTTPPRFLLGLGSLAMIGVGTYWTYRSWLNIRDMARAAMPAYPRRKAWLMIIAGTALGLAFGLPIAWFLAMAVYRRLFWGS